MLELKQPLPLDTPKGPGYAHFVIDYGIEHSLMWVCFIKETGECWTFSNELIRLQKNITFGIRVNQGASHGRVDNEI